MIHSQVASTGEHSEGHQGYASMAGAILMVACTFLSGMAYTSAQWLTIQTIRDSVFVSLLIAATMILVFGIRTLLDYLRERGMSFYSFVLGTDDPGKAYAEYQSFYRAVNNVRRMTVAGSLYGLIVGAAPLILGVWRNAPHLQFLLCAFLFCVNFVTGVAFYALLTFFRRSLAMGKLIRINLFHIENPSTSFLLGATRRISVLASAYICLSLTSILFSELPLGGLVIAYAAFAFLMLFASLIVPLIPIIQRLNEAKAVHIDDLDTQIDLLFQKALREFKSGNTELDLGKLNSLLQLKERVRLINVIPFRLKSISAAISVFVFSAIPVLLQMILTKLFG